MSDAHIIPQKGSLCARLQSEQRPGPDAYQVADVPLNPEAASRTLSVPGIAWNRTRPCHRFAHVCSWAKQTVWYHGAGYHAIKDKNPWPAGRSRAAWIRVRFFNGPFSFSAGPMFALALSRMSAGRNGLCNEPMPVVCCNVPVRASYLPAVHEIDSLPRWPVLHRSDGAIQGEVSN